MRLAMLFISASAVLLVAAMVESGRHQSCWSVSWSTQCSILWRPSARFCRAAVRKMRGKIGGHDGCKGLKNMAMVNFVWLGNFVQDFLVRVKNELFCQAIASQRVIFLAGY